MANQIDLQIHSTASDGKCSPADLIRMAKERGIQSLVLTDHDAVSGLEEFLTAGKVEGLKAISGIELSVEEHGVHILGYGIDYKFPALLEELKEAEQERIYGMKLMTENLKQAGFKVEWEDVLQEVSGTVVSRPHLARAILKKPENKEKLGPIADFHTFIENFLTEESPYYVKRKHQSALEAINLIKQAGGIAVWSHPAIHFPGDFEGLDDFLQKLIGWGLVGLEVFTSAHSEDEVELVQNLAMRYGLLRTAGSDFHEEARHPREPNGTHAADFMGDYETFGFSTQGIWEDLEDALNKKQLF